MQHITNACSVQKPLPPPAPATVGAAVMSASAEHLEEDLFTQRFAFSPTTQHRNRIHTGSGGGQKQFQLLCIVSGCVMKDQMYLVADFPEQQEKRKKKPFNQ